MFRYRPLWCPVSVSVSVSLDMLGPIDLKFSDRVDRTGPHPNVESPYPEESSTSMGVES